MQELQRFGSDIKVLFDTFSFKKKYQARLTERTPPARVLLSR